MPMNKTIQMTKRIFSGGLAVALLLIAARPLSAEVKPKTVPFPVAAPLAIPGATLNPGDYTIEVVNQLSDRIVLRVRDKSGSALTTFLGVRERQSSSRASGPVAWSNAVDGQKYLRAWNFQGAPSSVEFVYPKDDAVKIATANPSKVPAVDPGSEGKPTDSTLSQSDMELLNLWLLHLDQVGGGQGSIKAEKFESGSSPQQKPVVASLPHTASLMPVVWLVGLGALLAAALLRIFRVRSGNAAPYAR